MDPSGHRKQVLESRLPPVVLALSRPHHQRTFQHGRTTRSRTNPVRMDSFNFFFSLHTPVYIYSSYRCTSDLFISRLI